MDFRVFRRAAVAAPACKSSPREVCDGAVECHYSDSVVVVVGDEDPSVRQFKRRAWVVESGSICMCTAAAWSRVAIPRERRDGALAEAALESAVRTLGDDQRRADDPP